MHISLFTMTAARFVLSEKTSILSSAGLAKCPHLFPPDSRQVFVFRGGKLIPDTVDIHSGVT
jgi:hypothetical protein